MTLTTDGSLVCTTTHGPSRATLLTDAPADNGGTATSFSPTDLLGVALASCIVTTMAIAAKKQSVPWGPASAKVAKHMGGPPRRVAELVVEVTMPKELPKDQHVHFEHIAHGCPVTRSLSPETKISLTFVYS